MAVRPEEITPILKEQIEKFGAEMTATNVGVAAEAGAGTVPLPGPATASATALARTA